MPSLRRGTPWVLYALTWVSVAAAALVIWCGVAADQAAAPPPCHGIGWGCDLHPGEVAILVVIILGLPYLVVLAAVLGLLEIAGPRGTSMRVVVAGLGFSAPLIFATLNVVHA
jgi:hypothetical protein